MWLPLVLSSPSVNQIKTERIDLLLSPPPLPTSDSPPHRKSRRQFRRILSSIRRRRLCSSSPPRHHFHEQSPRFTARSPLPDPTISTATTVVLELIPPAPRRLLRLPAAAIRRCQAAAAAPRHRCGAPRPSRRLPPPSFLGRAVPASVSSTRSSNLFPSSGHRRRRRLPPPRAGTIKKKPPPWAHYSKPKSMNLMGRLKPTTYPSIRSGP